MADSLNYLGHSAEIIDYYQFIPALKKYEYWLFYFSESYARYISKILIRKVIDKKPDLVIVTYRDIHPAFVSGLKLILKNVIVVHYNPDQLTTLKNQQIFASDYDFYFSKDKYMVTFMRNMMALNAFYLPECFNQRYCNSIYKNKKEAEDAINIDVLVYGNFYPYRNRMIEHLMKQGLKVKLFGIGGPYFSSILKEKINKPIFGEEKANIILGSKIVFNNFHFAEITSVNEKYFVINGTGGFQICDYRDVLNDYSQIDIDQCSFKNINEAFEKIDFYLEHPLKRYEIAKTQQKHFLINHTYDIRMVQLLNIIHKT
jgi:spore maturation protein CgeB